MEYLKKAAIVGGSAVLGGATLVVAAPVVVSALGFSAGGIVAGSVGASMMSAMAPTVAGGVVATLQSVGAAGLGAGGTAALATIGSAIGGAAALPIVGSTNSNTEHSSSSSSSSSHDTQEMGSCPGLLYTKRGRDRDSSGVGGSRGGLICQCGLEAVQKTVHQGQNQGRQFHTCPKPQKEQCDFFEWVDVPSGRGEGSDNKTRTRPVSIANNGDGEPSPEKRAPLTPQERGSGPGFLYTKRGRDRGSSGVSGGRESLTCRCGLQAIQKTVHQGQNQGRQFHTCPKPQKEQCGFFEWADVPSGRGRGSCNKTRTRPVSIANNGDGGPAPEKRAPPTHHGRGSGPGFLYTKKGRGRHSSGVGGGRGSLTCQCGLQAVQKTVYQGQNQGKQFHACPKPQKEQCGFFEWADVPSGSGQGSGNKTRTRPVSIANDGDSGPASEKRAPHTCSLCDIPGHIQTRDYVLQKDQDNKTTC